MPETPDGSHDTTIKPPGCFIAFDAVKTEFSHPIIGNLFGLLLISLLLQPIVIAQWSLIIARAIGRSAQSG